MSWWIKTVMAQFLPPLNFQKKKIFLNHFQGKVFEEKVFGLQSGKNLIHKWLEK